VPYCNGGKPCDACIDKYLTKQAENIMHNQFESDPMIVREIGSKMVEALGKRQVG
jgi:hypothetical protein